MKRLAVLCSTDYNDYPVGGMMSFVRDAAPSLARHFDVDFWGVDAGGSARCFQVGGQTFPIRFFGEVCTGRRIVPNLVRVVWQLRRRRRELLAEDYDAIYIHGIPLNAALPWRMRARRINHVHGLTNPFLMQGLAGPRARVLAAMYARYRRRVVRRSDLTLLAADHLGIDAFRAQHPCARRISKIENFCDTQLFGVDAQPAERASIGLPGDASLIIHVGRFAHQKDPLLALRAFASYRDGPGRGTRCAMVMIGDGPLLDEGRALAADLQIASAVHFLGNLDRREIASWLCAADLYLYTSHANGYPIALAEAAQSGLPIVSTAVTGVHDLVVPGQNGCLVTSRDPAAFAPAIDAALAQRCAFGRRSAELASRYRPELVLERLTREIADVI